jgi:hypothetical protein
MKKQQFEECVEFLQAIARLTYNEGEIFQPDEYIYTGQTSGMDHKGQSLITGFITHLDKLGEINTPNGKLQFVDLIGVTDAELKAIIDKKLNAVELFDRLGSECTDYKRESLFWLYSKLLFLAKYSTSRA